MVYDFGYYLGSEEMDEMFKYAAQYVSQDKETESSFLNELEDSLQSENIFVVQDVNIMKYLKHTKQRRRRIL